MKQEIELVATEVSKAILKAAVIDDAFDSIEDEEVRHDQLKKFLQIAKQDQFYITASAELSFPEIDINVVEEDDEDFKAFLNTLWISRNHSPEFRNLLSSRLFQKRFEKTDQLQAICENLEQLNIEVTQIGSDLASKLDDFAEKKYNLIFIDYYLGAVEDEEAVEAAIENIKLIHAKYPEGKKPTTVLMSSLNVAEKAEEFYEKAKIMAIPRFYHKSDLQNTHLIKLITGILKREFSSRDQLEKYGEAITNAAEKALKEFKERVEKLNVEDFIFIQNSVLKDDKQPLGDYLAWLFGAYWGHLLFQDSELQRHAEVISLFYINAEPVIHRQPSKVLSEMYMSALFETVLKDIESHPGNQTPQLGKNNDETNKDLPYLHLGDILVSDYHKEVWMVLNPQCDLERVVPADRSVLLLPGHLSPIGEQPKDTEIIRTEFFRYKNKPYRIIWDIKSTITKAMRDFNEWKSMQACERRFRLRLPFALEIQQAFVAAISRVGLPVPPPITQPLKLEVRYLDVQTKKYKELIHSDTDYCSQMITREEGSVEIRYIVTAKLMIDFKRAIVRTHQTLTNELSLLEDKSSAVGKELKKNIEKIESILEEFDGKFLNLNYFDSKVLPQLGKIGLKKNIDFENFEPSNFFMMNIIDVA
jgi:hypothetical protein